MFHRGLLNCNQHINGPCGEGIFHSYMSYRQKFCADDHVIFATENFAKFTKTMKKTSNASSVHTM